MDPFRLRDYTRQHCPEWEDPHGASACIPYERLMKHGNRPHAEEIAERIETTRGLDHAFKRADRASRNTL